MGHARHRTHQPASASLLFSARCFCSPVCVAAMLAELGPEAIRAILLRFPTPLDLYRAYQVRPVSQAFLRPERFAMVQACSAGRA